MTAMAVWFVSLYKEYALCGREESAVAVSSFFMLCYDMMVIAKHL